MYYTKPVLDIQDLIRFSWACGRVKKTAVFRAIFKMLQCEGGRWENSKSCWRLGVLMSGKEWALNLVDNIPLTTILAKALPC